MVRTTIAASHRSIRVSGGHAWLSRTSLSHVAGLSSSISTSAAFHRPPVLTSAAASRCPMPHGC